jgi:hypothetical protein
MEKGRARTKEDSAGRAGMREEGDGPKSRARTRSPGYDVTNFLFTFLEAWWA